MLTRNKWWLISLMAYLDLFIGLGLLVYSGFAARETLAARGWPTTSGVVTFAGIVERSSGEDQPVYAADLRYNYTVGSQPYQGTRIRAVQAAGTPDSAAAESVLKRYVPGQQIPVYYNPDHPERAVLEQGFDPALWLPIGLGVFFLLSGAAAAVEWSAYVRRHSEQPNPHVEVL